MEDASVSSSAPARVVAHDAAECRARDPWVTAYVALGANLGDRWENLVRAVQVLDTPAEVQVDLAGGVAGLYESAPVGGRADQPPYLNSVVRLTTLLSPRALLAHLLDVESRLGRQRTERWGPRTIDLDLLFYDDLILQTPDLTLPHPRLAERLFVLEPLAEVADRWRHPVLGVSVAELRDRCRTARLAAQPQDDPAGVLRVAGPEWPTAGSLANGSYAVRAVDS
jgi:2-amino-4-hydroxy-6-hydroxymethyldihydropteridine diphosphokinase